MGRCMTAATVVGPHFLSSLRRASQQQVGERRLAYPRRTNKGDGPVTIEKRLKIMNAVASASAHDLNWNPSGYPGNLGRDLDGVIYEICLIDHDHRSGA